MKTGRILAALTAFVLGVQAQTFVVVPGGLQNVEGDTQNYWPFDTSGYSPPFGSARYQQVYGAGAFSTVPAGGMLITQIAFRPGTGYGGAFTSTLPDIRIDLSTTTAGVDGLSSTFANNVGADDTIVFGGASGSALSLSSSDIGPMFGPKNFDIIINLTTPFFYNPAAGNLLMDVRNYGGGTTTPFDATDMAGDAVSRVYTFFNGVDSPTAEQNNTWGLVTQFTITTVPEPCSTMLIAFGGLISMLRRGRRSGKEPTSPNAVHWPQAPRLTNAVTNP